MGRIEALAVSVRKGQRKTCRDRVRFIVDHGIEGDAHAGPWHRQVSLLADEDIAAMRAHGLPELEYGDFAENVVLSGINLDALGLGSRIQLGGEVQLQITQIGKQCHTRCHIYDTVGDCIMPRRGLFARVVAAGQAAVGDPAVAVHLVPRSQLQAVVLTISDRCSRGEAEDTAGPGVAELLRRELGAHVYAVEVLPDERPQIADRLRHYCDGHSIDLVATVGGTGFSPRDVTPEATREVVDRLAPGLDEAMRAASLQQAPHAMLSRGASGIRQSTLIVNLPGSKRAAEENLRVVLTALPHGLAKLRGDTSECGRPLRTDAGHV
ncbi:MAG: molybdenum cofactor synthesis domain-containing protein [Planctomycetota bacterium]